MLISDPPIQVNTKLFVITCALIATLIMTPNKSNADTALAVELDDVSITYKIKLESKAFNAILGKITNSIKKTENGFTVQSVTKVQGMAAILIGSNEQQSCDFIMQDGYAIPQRYVGGTIKKDQYEVDFDWQERKITFEDGESLDMPKGYIVDNCSMAFALALQKGKGLEEKSVYIVDGKKNRVRGYTLLSSEDVIIETPLGNKDTTKIVLQRELRPDRTLTFWLSKEEQYIPVKMQDKRKSRTTTITVSSINAE